MPLNTEQKLIWLGLNNIAGQEQAWKQALDSLKSLYDFDEIKDKFQNDWDSFSDYASDVNADNRTGDGGIDEYQTWENKLVSVYTEVDNVKNPTTEEKEEAWSEHEAKFLSEYEDYSDFENEFSTSMAITGTRRTSDGDTAAGVRIHDSPGRTKDGFTVPEGTVEVFGGEIHFSQTGKQRSGAGEGGTTSPTIVYRNLSVSNLTPDIGESITVTAEVKNEGESHTSVVVAYKEDDEVVQEKSRFLRAKQVQEVEFTASKDEQQSVEVSVGDTESKTVVWIPPGITR
mgnify:CR=1 FL=1